MYYTIHSDNAAKGGSAIIIRGNIQHHEQLKYELEHKQATTVCVKTKDCESYINSIYSPLRHSI